MCYVHLSERSQRGARTDEKRRKRWRWWKRGRRRRGGWTGGRREKFEKRQYQCQPTSTTSQQQQYRSPRCIQGCCSWCAFWTFIALCVAARGGDHRCVCRDCRERGSEPKPPELRQTGEIWALLPYYRPPSILNEGKEVSIALLHVYLHICVFFSFLLRSTGSFIVVAPVCLCVPCHWHMATNACTVVGSRNVTFVITPILASLLLRVYSVFSQYHDYRLKLNITSSVLKY